MDTFDMNIAFPGGSRVDAAMDEISLTTGEEGQFSPFDLFLAGLGTCSAIKVLRFCQEREIPTENITMRQRMFHNPASNMIEKIEFVIYLPPDFPKKYRPAVIRAANTCGVKKHLLTPPEFQVRLASELIAE